MAYLPVQLLPYALRLRLDSFNRVYEHDSAVYYSASTLNLHAKVRVAWRIYQVERPLFPFDRDTGGLDGYSSFALCRQKVCSCAASVHRA